MLANELERLHTRNELPDVDALTQQIAPRPTDVPNVVVELPKLASYDALLEAAS